MHLLQISPQLDEARIRGLKSNIYSLRATKLVSPRVSAAVWVRGFLFSPASFNDLRLILLVFTGLKVVLDLCGLDPDDAKMQPINATNGDQVKLTLFSHYPDINSRFLMFFC